MNRTQDIGYIILIGILGVVVRVSYGAFVAEELDWFKITARLIISVTIGWIIGNSINSNITRYGVELYGPIIRLGSFFSVDIVQRLLSDKAKSLAQTITKKIIDKVK